MKVQDKKPVPMVVIACIVKRSGRILLIKRGKPPYTSLLSMPGGKVEFGEHPVSAALRETEEETGLKCRFEKMLGVFSEVLEATSGKQHFIIFVCLLTAPSFEVKNSPEGETIWVEETKWHLIKPEVVPSDWIVVKDFLFEKNSQMEIREVKMCEKLRNDEVCYELEEFIAP